VKIIGNKSGLTINLRKIIKLAENKTRKNKKISLQLALNYGSKQEIINSMKIINKKKQKITIKNFEKNLYTSGFPEPDILIRTGNQRRLSNFLLWQIAYTEIFFVRKMWPDFSNNDFRKILNKFKKIKRNFGNV
jgi:undecaprenyl diphosphate synthase